MLRLVFTSSWLPCLLMLFSSGCCCVQGVGDCGMGCGMGAMAVPSCSTGSCGSSSTCSTGNCGGPLAMLAGCRGACGEVYVDEWISEPPTPDNCGYSCGGCGNCGQCTPVRSLLRLLWGRPYVTQCDTGLCGPTCDSGCDSCGGGYVEEGFVAGDHVVGHSGGCNCGGHIDHAAPQPIPREVEIVPQTSPEVVPTPAPTIAPTSATRLNPAKRRAAVTTASATR